MAHHRLGGDAFGNHLGPWPVCAPLGTDFNQMLNIKTRNGSPNVRDLPDILAGQEISTGDHCYGCTAGSGSSCGGSLL